MTILQRTELSTAKNIRKATLEPRCIASYAEDSFKKNTYSKKKLKILKGGKSYHFAKAIVRQNDQKWMTFGMSLQISQDE